VNRVIGLLRVAPTVGFVHIGQDFKRDLEWFVRFAQVYNGVTRFDKSVEDIDFVVYTDASFKVMGACVNNWVYEYAIEGDGSNIAHWEALNLLVALRMWAAKFKHVTVKIFCDNAAAVSVFQTHRASDKILQAIARNIWLLAAIWDIKLHIEHIPGRDDVVTDLLSRWRTCSNPVAKLYAALNNIPCWYQVKSNDLLLDWLI
jgi:hypothetical protein